jgi:galactokinase
MILSEKVKASFNNYFGSEPSLFIAPGRINMIGEHTDYNDGFVMPTAIDKHFVFAIANNESELFNVHALDLDEKVSFSRTQLKRGHSWQNYLMGVVDGLTRRDKIPGGVNCLFSGNIPAGAGLSSSAALCSGFGFALNELFGLGLSRLDLAKIAQESEHNFVGAKVGIMDMYASLFSKKDSVMLLDCRNYKHEYRRLKFEHHEILLIDTKVKHSLASSAYNNRREACEEGVSKLQRHFENIEALRDVSLSMLEKIKPEVEEDVYKRCLYIVQEIKRTEEAAVSLKANDVTGFGKMMYETHWGLSKLYEVSCDESDWLVRLAAENQVTGARQMGGGFGGCTINLILKDQREAFIEKVRKKYFGEFKKEADFYTVNLADGVGPLMVNR